VLVASDVLQVLADVLRETHTVETEEWIDRLVNLHQTHCQAMERINDSLSSLERNRLQRLQRSWLLLIIRWSAELGTTRYGHCRLQELLGEQCWTVATLQRETNNDHQENEEEEDILELHCDAVQHMALAEQPMRILEWLKTLPSPTQEQTTLGHACPPATRDMLLTRAILLLTAVENIRDANQLLQEYAKQVETRDIQTLADNYTKKDAGQAPAHVIFCNMLVQILQKDQRTGPLYQWLMRSFKKELEHFYKPQQVISYTTKIGKIYFGIEPPPTMFQMMENMMGMMGGGGAAPGANPGINPAMMQAALASIQGGQF
jgi:hypothetical protein